MADGFNAPGTGAFFTASLESRDPALFQSITHELTRQRDEIELIASENIVSRAVMEAQGSVMTNKYAEGYPGRRYYGGCQHVDVAEDLAIERICKLFDCKFANVQPHSGAQANQAVMLATIMPGDTVLGMDLASGGHLTHGAKPNLSGKWFNAIQYGVTKDTNLIHSRRLGHSSPNRQQALPRDCGQSRRDPARRYGAFFGFGCGRASSQPARALPCCDLHHAQDVARPAWRHHPDK